MSNAVLILNFAKDFFIGFIAAAIWVVPLIDFLYKMKFLATHKLMKNGVNKIFFKINKERAKIGTPSLGGILIWLTVPAVWWFLFKTPLARAFAISFFFIGLYGFVDEVFTQFFIKRSEKYRLLSETFGLRVFKLLTMYLLFTGVAYLVVSYLGVSSFWFFGYRIPLPMWAIPVLAFFMLTSSYATEIIDGVDGLSTGLYLITLVGFLALNMAFPNTFMAYGVHSIGELLAVLMGVLIVYLYFNIPPARVFMGSPGALPMGAIFLLVALYTDTVEAFLFFILIFILDLATSVLQILSVKIRKKRLFAIAPIHHYFQHKGWSDAKVTMRAWLVQILLVALGILVQVYVKMHF